MSGNFGCLKMEQLKEELGRRGLKKTGRKTDLVERLEAYDRMKIGTVIDEAEP